jgi:hypothetical protein
MVFIKPILLITAVFIFGSCSVSQLKKEEQKAIDTLASDYQAHYGYELTKPIVLKHGHYDKLLFRAVCRDFRDGKRTLIINHQYGVIPKWKVFQYVRACSLHTFGSYTLENYYIN